MKTTTLELYKELINTKEEDIYHFGEHCEQKLALEHELLKNSYLRDVVLYTEFQNFFDGDMSIKELELYLKKQLNNDFKKDIYETFLVLFNSDLDTYHLREQLKNDIFKVTFKVRNDFIYIDLKFDIALFDGDCDFISSEILKVYQTLQDVFFHCDINTKENKLSLNIDWCSGKISLKLKNEWC